MSSGESCGAFYDTVFYTGLGVVTFCTLVPAWHKRWIAKELQACTIIGFLFAVYSVLHDIIPDISSTIALAMALVISLACLVMVCVLTSMLTVVGILVLSYFVTVASGVQSIVVLAPVTLGIATLFGVAKYVYKRITTGSHGKDEGRSNNNGWFLQLLLLAIGSILSGVGWAAVVNQKSDEICEFGDDTLSGVLAPCLVAAFLTGRATALFVFATMCGGGDADERTWFIAMRQRFCCCCCHGYTALH
jgi:hypothetical protein